MKVEFEVHWNPKIGLPILVLAFGLLGMSAMIWARPTATPRAVEDKAPLVRIQTVVPGEQTFAVHAQGTVEPRTESDLVAEVGGRVRWVSGELGSGGFVEAGDELVRLDPADQRVALERARAAAERAASQHVHAQANLERRRTLTEGGVASQAVLDDAENAERVAAASLREARAALAQAERDLERTRLRAPFTGRVREKLVDVGQYVTRGSVLARLYAVDYAEVRLAIPDRELAFLDLPLGAGVAPKEGPAVELTGQLAGRTHTWVGRIVRTEGAIDPRTRMVRAVARVEDPYGLTGDGGAPPLAVGLFVDARIHGRQQADLIVLPRAAVRGEDQVAVVDSGERLRLRRVAVARTGREQVWVRDGLDPGDRVCVSPLEIAVDGMRVRVSGEES
ncbi:MAG: efflux RND transporter periplasmic adaptor subunit [Proteobacteria bacterium]|nr:efflux RND transporter periplasmic adaptor subunit [Pseudomonadota bacterium]